MPQSNTTGTQESVQEYSIRVPKNGRKKFNLMRFHGNHNIDFVKWTNTKMERENNMKEYKGADEEIPKFGAGSEFGRDQREEARRKKLGFNARKYKPEDQPWILKHGGKNGKKFKGIREGGVSENASYYVFTHAADGAIEAFPVEQWYNFTPIQTYKALSAEEAEQEFGKRNRVLNFFTLMMRKRLRGDEDLPGDDGATGSDETKSRKSNKAKEKELKISEMDEWMETSSDDNSDEDKEKEKKDSDDENKQNKKGSKGKGKEATKKKKKKQRDSDAEAFEDSDDGDEEGRELDYISSSSESEVEAEKQLQGVSEEKALRKLLNSDDDSDEDENKSNSDKSDDDKDDEKEKKNKEEKDEGKKKKKLKKKDTKKKKESKKESSSDFSSDSDSDPEVQKKKKEVKKEGKEASSATNSRSPSPNVGGDKRKLIGDNNVPAKKAKLDVSASLPSYLGSNSDSGITEEAVRRYLMRKPMTTTELLQKFKTKKTGLNSEQLVNIMTQILKKINPIKQTIKNKMYLSIKPQ